MSEDFWQIARPFLPSVKTAQAIVYGSNDYLIFKALMLKIGFSLAKENCVICVSDGQKELRRLYLKGKSMSDKSDQKYILRDIRLPFEGKAYTKESMTDAVAQRMLKKFPSYITFFESIPSPKKATSKKEKPSE